MNFASQRVVIVGGSSGLGLATAIAAAAEGAEVVIASSRQASIDTALTQLPETATGFVLDVLDENAVAAFFDGVGEFDHLVYTAGEALALLPIEGIDLGKARDFFQIRYFGALAVISAGVSHIKKGGSITLTSGSAAERPGAGWGIGASVCGAMTSLTKALAVELAPIRVNVISPGVVRSPLWGGMSEEDREGLYEQQGSVLPVGRVGEVEDVAQAYLYAMSQRFGTGASISVDGGTVLV
jgi:NAD(P)-dependent dehydrogenase (short-subunit alcohol dehydrogenase family)